MKPEQPRRSAKSAGFWPQSKKILRYDRHGDLVEVDEDVGVDVRPREDVVRR